MPATKNSILGKLRKQSRAQGRGLLSASANSAFAALTQRNEEYTTTTTTSSLKRKETDLQMDGQPDSRGPKKRRGKKVPVKKPRRKVAAEVEMPVVVECWRPAGGEHLLLSAGRQRKVTTSDTLGVARVATWRLRDFREGVEKLLKEEGVEYVELSTQETVHGGESVTDVRLRFRDPGQAEMARGKLEGQMVGGRKLQVRIA
ncbi:hypothetical protein KC343_g11507 [Hortaea werneckii]|nr:hypothetical protein KC338_g2808 [Hortaea werneckii]KAI7115896.1 hypothetical protein KC352_g34201 [Hortaea werneckii]KAI7355222.1 hypothetical protein KC320_g2920 [Hortaea werneckii]KAI7569401.1 hypothetical protein KC317_g3368 [Hortaea werneckii]KAI7606759.1 hypothetical protein KC346_g10382 [Hortaea werneckii]